MSEKHQKQIYTFLGLPAAGKGTQARVFADSRGYDLIGMGDLIREEIENGDPNDPLIKEMVQRYDDGLVQKDEIVFDLIIKKLEEFKKSDKEGIVLDNFPFSFQQAQYLSNYIEKNDFDEPTIVNVNIAPETALRRITQRRICPQCDAIYSSHIEECKKCHVPLVTREDDNVETVKTRIDEYLPQIKEIDDYYRNIGRVVDIDGEKSVPEVTEEINTKL